jgi:mercuric reductase
LEDLPGHLIVIGGRYIALENAQMMARLGSRVTVLQRSARILPTEAPEITDALTGLLRAEGMDVLTGTAIQSVASGPDGVSVQVLVDGESTEIQGTHLFMATGRLGNTDDLGLEALGIGTDGSGYLKTGPDLRSTVSTVFGAGDVLGDNQFVYTAAYEGKLAAQNAFRGGIARADYSVLPWVVFTDPQVAGVGMDERQAEEAGLTVDVSTIGLEHVPRAIAARDTRGFITLIRNRATDVLVGARILAPEGSELLMEIALAIRHRVTVDSLKSEFHPYLTMSEGIKLAAISFDKSVGKLSCCAA